jgi:hypothetical protein
VQRQGGDTPDDGLAAKRQDAQRIRDDGMAKAFKTLDDAQNQSTDVMTAAANDLTSQVAGYRKDLEDYQKTIAGQMALNGGLLKNEIDGAFQLYDEMNKKFFDKGHLVAGQETNFKTWWSTNGATMEQQMTGALDQINHQARMLEPMYVYGKATGSYTGDVEWTKVDTSFMAATGDDAGSIYLPYHTNARASYGAKQYDQLFPWEGMAAVADTEQRALHPAADGLSPDDRKFFGQHWIGETIGVYQTMLMRADAGSNPTWGNLPIQALRNLPGYSKYATSYPSPNAAALQGNQYAPPTFLADFGDTKTYGASDKNIRDHGIAKDYYALAATMFFTGLHIDSPYNTFDDRDNHADVRGGTGKGDVPKANATNAGTTDQATFGNYTQDGSDPIKTVLTTTFQDPRVGGDPITYGMDVTPQDISATPADPGQNGTVQGTKDAGGLKLRSGPGQSYPASAAMADGTHVTILYTSGDWSYVSISGREGWVASANLGQ